MMLLVLLLYMLFASTFTIGKAALAYTTPVFLIALRMLIGGTLLLVYQYWYNAKLWQFACQNWWLLLQVSVFQYYGAFVLEFLALQWLTSAKACLIYNVSPFVTALLSFFLLHERLSMKQCVGLIIGFLGLLPILFATTPLENFAGSIALVSMPELLQLGSVMCACYGWILVKQIQSRGYSIWMINAISMPTAGIMALVTSLISEGRPFIIPPHDCLSYSFPWLCRLFEPYGSYWASVTVFLVYTLLLILIANIIGFNLYGYLLTQYSPTFLSFAGAVTPLFAALFGWLFLAEKIGWEFFATVAILFCGLLLFYQDELQLSKNS